ALVLAHAGRQNLTRVTTMSMSNAGVSWNFAGFDVIDVSAGRVMKTSIPSLPPEKTAQTFFRGFAPTMTGSFAPPPPAPLDLTALANPGSAMRGAAATEDALTALPRLDDPRATSPETVDCASCHLAT